MDGSLALRKKGLFTNGVVVDDALGLALCGGHCSGRRGAAEEVAEKRNGGQDLVALGGE